jgi:molybdopterin molybdotransferase
MIFGGETLAQNPDPRLRSVRADAAPSSWPSRARASAFLADDLRAPFDVPPRQLGRRRLRRASATFPPPAARHHVVVPSFRPAPSFDERADRRQAIRIMTGAPMPRSDTVYPQEVVERSDGRVRVGAIKKGANVRMRGEDVQADTVAIERGTVLRPQELGLIASLGFWQIPCIAARASPALDGRRGRSSRARRARPGRSTTPIASRCAGRSNNAAARCSTSASCRTCATSLRARLLAAAERGRHRGHVGRRLRRRARSREGRPRRDRRDRLLAGGDAAGTAARAFGRINAAHFFGLPGNPVASMLASMLFLRPAIYKLAGRRRLFPDTAEATTLEPISKRKGRREFKRGIVEWRNGRWEARTTGPQGSGILSSMAAGNCLIVLEEERGDVAAGETVLVEPF